MRIHLLPDGRKGRFVGPSFSEVMEAANFVKPYWVRLYALRQELTQLRRSSAREGGSVRERATVNSGLDNLKRQTKSLLVSFEQHVPQTDPTGKVSLLREAMKDFLFACADRSFVSLKRQRVQLRPWPLTPERIAEPRPAARSRSRKGKASVQ